MASLRYELANNIYYQENSNPDGRFSKTGYYWLHGYKVSKNHTCESCTKRKDGHKDKANQRNTTGGSDWNRGWVT